MKKLTTKNIRHYSRRYAKSKTGTSLVELIAVIAILAITSSSCLSAMFAMVDVSKRGQQVSESQRICALLGEQFLLYGNTAVEVAAYYDSPTTPSPGDPRIHFNGYHAYDSVSNIYGFMDAMNTSADYGDFNDFFVTASTTQKSTIVFSRFDTTLPLSHGPKTITSIEGVEKIDFEILPFECFYNPDQPSDVVTKYILRYTILTVYGYEITGGVVMNNTIDGVTIPAFDNVSIVTDPDLDDGVSPTNSDTILRIRSTNRQDVDRD